MSNGEVVDVDLLFGLGPVLDVGYEGWDNNPWRVAGERGQVVRIPEANEVFLDLDTEEQYTQFGVQMAMLNRAMAKSNPASPAFFVLAEERPSRKGLPHRHVVVRCGRNLRSPWERLLLQAVLGSDPKREALGWARLATESRFPSSVFFETPGGTS